MNNRKRILYLINVPWGWIKQRPHFMAEYLSWDYDVTVYARSFMSDIVKKSQNLVDNDINGTKNLRIITYKTFSLNNYPFLKKLGIHRLLNKFLLKYQFKKVKEDYDIVWYGNPLIYNEFKSLIPGNPLLIYDCMDDYLEFPMAKSDNKLRKRIFEAEKELISRSSLTIASSQYLLKKIQNRYNLNKDFIVVNNAIEIPSDSVKGNCPNILNGIKYSLVYIGTVSEWFDFDLMVQILDKYSELYLILVGPLSVDVPKHERIKCTGPVSHDKIFSFMNHSSSLVMPFKINELILSVNPVKLYEYIYSGRPVISVRYEETEKFEKYVHLYNGFEEFDSIISKLMKGELISPTIEMCHKYVESNTWKCRIKDISQKLNILAIPNK